MFRFHTDRDWYYPLRFYWAISNRVYMAERAGTCDYCGKAVKKGITCEVCGATVGPDHKKEYGCAVCKGRVSV